ncbi:hypothetical protein SAMN04488515_2049 [Cognatiyoonia koreensis]|uniref:Uncharacterized protein n=1 Tax=Cognatiyoonia koreensis TaxID=364200 RepID=A0A1I0QP81_9RHOB|nr:hypothetical protein [Cognatiyoonia koreensis]SEW28916.1 hypothetical protein SAMN04488515_2049 [Cognatiyoonia koreensis]
MTSKEQKISNKDQVTTPIQDGIIKDLSLLAFRTMVTLNGGAFLVLLTYLGNVDISHAPFELSVPKVKSALFFFLAGISATLIGIAVAYTSAQATNSGRSVFRYNFVIFISVMTGPAIFSAIFFVRGVFLAITAIQVP